MKKKLIKTGSDFSGVGAFDYAIERVAKRKGFNHKRVFACDWDKFARKTYVRNHGNPEYYPCNVYERDIPKEPLDIYMTSPPCQAFSLAGKKKGKEDERGVLFFKSYEFIKENNPRFFIFENVKGLISNDEGNTFSEWLNMLGGKSVNGIPVIFPYEKSVPYHIYFKVLNSDNYAIPQQRERVFIVGVRDDSDNNFRWPKEKPKSKLIDFLDSNVDKKYNISKEKVKKLLGERIDSLKSDKSESVKVLKKSRSEDQKAERRRTGTNKFQGSIFRFIETETMPCITTGIYAKEKILCIPVLTPDRVEKRKEGKKFRENGDPSYTITTQDRHGLYDGKIIRKITPRESFRLQGFPECFDFSVVSDSQAYKQAGNSITIDVLEEVIMKLNL